MLIDFSLENFGPYCERATLSMLGSTDGESLSNVVPSHAARGGILTSAVIFGPNASGKSYMIKAMAALQAMVSGPVPPGYEYPWYRPFMMSAATAKAPVSLGIDVIIDGTVYCYSITFNSKRVVAESLHSYPNGHKSIVFIREGSEFRFGRTNAKGQKGISQMTGPGSAYLAVAAQFNNAVCSAVHDAIMNSIAVIPDGREAALMHSVSMIESDPELKSTVLRALRMADTGISDIRIEKGTLGKTHGTRDPRMPYPGIWPSDAVPDTRRVWLVHDHKGADNPAGLVVPMDCESEGTWQLIGQMVPIVDALMRGGTVVIDEFASNLHPRIGRWLLSLFGSQTNPFGAQLVASTNDHTLMDMETLLRKDQVYFAHKDSVTGASELYSLFDYDEGWLADDISVRLPRMYQPLPHISDDILVRRARQY
ncbi:MAG: ATP-binding protein [Thermoplasmata archaeon]|nr:ATP-binding protein [Thermoplasmata archaeon]